MEKTKRTFRVITNDSIGNQFIWEVYTLDGQSPDNTQYFFQDNDSPSYDAQNKIADKIQLGDYLEIM